jgi:transposase
MGLRKFNELMASHMGSIRAYLAEFGIVAPVGRNGVERLLEVVAASV